jgi:predicted nucleic acid-binding protein
MVDPASGPFLFDTSAEGWLGRNSSPAVGRIEAARVAYLSQLGDVLPVDSAVAVVAGEIIALIPEAPTPPRRFHRLEESRQQRLARWRFDGLIAATALVAGIPLVHNNARDFEAIRSAIETSPERFPLCWHEYKSATGGSRAGEGACPTAGAAA